MARIDAHQHFWRYSPQTHGWITDSMAVLKQDFLPEDLAPLLKRRGYDGCVAVQAEMAVSETHWLLDLADQHPFIRGVVGWVDLCAPDVATTLAPLAGRKKLRGIRHIVQAEPDDFLARPQFRRGISQLARTGLSYDILVYARQMPAAVSFAAAFPDQHFVLDHLGKPDIRHGEYRQWQTHLARLAAMPNVWCKLSGLVTEADWRNWTHGMLRPYLDAALDAFGPSRLMMGSDWPVCTVAASYSAVLDLIEAAIGEYSADEQAQILGGTARRLWNLNEEHTCQPGADT
jgi:L-fuconolactonase